MNINQRLFSYEPLTRCLLNNCHGVCCSYGVWLDIEEMQDIQNNASLIIPHMRSGCEQPELWFDGHIEDDEFAKSGKVIHSRLINDPDAPRPTTCIFRRKDGKCALQVAASMNNLHPWRFKPFYCILHPLDLDEEGNITLPDRDEILDEPASCLRYSDKKISLLVTFEEELRYFLGNERYEQLLQTPPMHNV